MQERQCFLASKRCGEVPHPICFLCFSQWLYTQETQGRAPSCPHCRAPFGDLSELAYCLSLSTFPHCAVTTAVVSAL